MIEMALAVKTLIIASWLIVSCNHLTHIQEPATMNIDTIPVGNMKWISANTRIILEQGDSFEIIDRQDGYVLIRHDTQFYEQDYKDTEEYKRFIPYNENISK